VTWTFEMEYALLVGDDLTISGNSVVRDVGGNDGAHVHANGRVIEIGGAASVEGCLTSSETTYDATMRCPESPRPELPLPVVEPLLLYPYAHFVLCPDNTIYGGPAHPTDPDPDGDPCSGDEIATPVVGWSARRRHGATEWTTSPAADTDGVFYIHHGNFNGKVGSTTDLALVSVVASASGGAACSSPSEGNIELGGNSNLEAHPDLIAAGYELLLVAQGDVAFNGGSWVGGGIIAHEQVDYRGNAGSWGAVVAADACDATGSPLRKTSLTGSTEINFTGLISTPFTANTLRAELVGWYEL
jgi:hypothetical protein